MFRDKLATSAAKGRSPPCGKARGASSASVAPSVCATVRTSFCASSQSEDATTTESPFEKTETSTATADAPAGADDASRAQVVRGTSPSSTAPRSANARASPHAAPRRKTKPPKTANADDP